MSFGITLLSAEQSGVEQNKAVLEWGHTVGLSGCETVKVISDVPPV